MAFNAPDLKVEIAFATTNAFDTSPTWTDVSAYVLNNPGLRITRGRPNELTTFSSGRCTFTLDNRDARFSPLNASSPYVGQLLPRRQVRVSATWAATDYVMFRGYVMGWPQGYDAGGINSVVSVECYDAFAILNETKLADMYYGYQKTGIGSLETSLRRIGGRSWVDQVTGHTWPSRSSNLSVPADLVAGLSDSDAVEFDGTFGMNAVTPVSATASYALSLWFRAATPASQQYLLSGENGTSSPMALWLDTAGVLNYSNDTDTVASTGSLADGQVHHVVIVLDTVTPQISMYVDGVVNAVGSVVSNSDVFVDRVGSGGPAGAFGTGYLEGKVQDFALFSKNVSATEVQTLYRIGMGAVSETTAVRFGRVCDSAGVPSALRNTAGITTPYGRCAETFASGSTALAQLQLVAATEQGALFVGRTGLVTLLDRYWHQGTGQGGVVQITFSDDGADSAYASVGFDYDDLLVQNQITVTSEAGSAFYLDQTSIDKYGLQDATITTQLGSYSELRTMAEGLIYWRKNPQVRTRPITVQPQIKTSTWPTILELDLQHRIKVEITPPGMGSQYTDELLIQQIDWDISADEWAFTVQGSPVPMSFGLYTNSEDFDADVLFGF